MKTLEKLRQAKEMTTQQAVCYTIHTLKILTKCLRRFKQLTRIRCKT